MLIDYFDECCSMWRIGYCFSESMMHVRDWCAIKCEFSIYFSLYSFASCARTRVNSVCGFFPFEIHLEIDEIFLLFRDHVLCWNNFSVFFGVCVAFDVVQINVNVNDFVYTCYSPIK